MCCLIDVYKILLASYRVRKMQLSQIQSKLPHPPSLSSLLKNFCLSAPEYASKYILSYTAEKLDPVQQVWSLGEKG